VVDKTEGAESPAADLMACWGISRGMPTIFMEMNTTTSGKMNPLRQMVPVGEMTATLVMPEEEE